jgi:preprotein translocase SecE subunit
VVSETVDTIRGGDDAVEKSGGGGAGQFIKETREELEKVSFPSGEDVRNTTIIVIVNVIFFAIFLFLIDRGWVYALQGLEWLINKAAGI